MQRIYCKYHSQNPARWSCTSCKINFCQQCVNSPAKGTHETLCPVCKKALSSLGVGNVIPAFWERIPQFFAYPAKFDNLVYIIFLSVASLGFFIPIVGIIVPFLVLLANLKYAYVLLEHTALGNLEPPTSGLTNHNSSPYKQFVIFTFMALVVGIVFVLLGNAAGIVTYIAVMFSIPASVMSLAMSGSLVFAMNPANLARLIGSIGWPYCLLYVFLMFLSGGNGVLTHYLIPILPLPAVMVISTFLSAYFTIIMFHMMGYAIYQYHEALGLQNVKEYAPASAKLEPKVDNTQTEINILLSEGRIDEAKARLKAELRNSAKLEYHQSYHKLLLLGNDMEELARHGREYVSLLMGKAQKTTALDVCAACFGAFPDFSVEQGTVAYELAQTAVEQARHQDTALRILKGFGKRYPRHEKTPAAGLLAAKLLCEYKLQDGQAKALLEQLLRQYPEHELTGEIQQYLQMMGRLQQVGKIQLNR